MKPVLLATDGSPTAQEATKDAIELAKAFGAPLVVVTSWDIIYTPYGPVAPMAIPQLEDIEKEAEKVLEETRHKAEKAGVEVETVLRRGIPAQQILDVASELEPRLLVMGSHGWGPIRRFLFGSVSSAVLHDAPCPVLIARPPTGHAPEKEEKEEVGVAA